MQDRSNQRLGRYRIAAYASATLAAVTIVTFGFALLAVPISGSNCPSNCIEYPYLDTIDRFPRDYIWMFFAIVMLIAYIVFVVALRTTSKNRDSVSGTVAVVLAGLVAAVLVPMYFVQASVVPSSLAAEQTEGISLLTQYNPHGLFIAVEEIGYLLMSLSFLFLVKLIDWDGMLSKIVRWAFVAGFAIPLVSFIAIAAVYGFDRQDRFEIIVIAVNWLVLIVNGLLLAVILRRLANPDTNPWRP